MPYNVRATIGKFKGKFVRKKTKERIEAVIKNTKGKQGRKINVDAEEREVSIILIACRYFFYYFNMK